MTTKNPNKPPKNKLTPIKDISKSLLFIRWEKNKVFELDISPLQDSRKKNIIYKDTSNNLLINNQRSIKTKDNTLNMSINDILDK